MNHIVRRVLPHEYPKYRQHLKRLDRESQILRFGYPISEYVIDQLCDRFESNASKHVLFCVEDAELNFIGVGHVSLEDGMELAFSVFKEYQGQGIGNALMVRAIHWCQTHGITNGCMVCLSSNLAIRRLCAKHGISMKNDHGETSAELRLPEAKVDTFIQEAIDSNAAVIDWVTKRALLPATKRHRQLKVQ